MTAPTASNKKSKSSIGAVEHSIRDRVNHECSKVGFEIWPEFNRQLPIGAYR
jgi:hypothetical protein